MPHIEFVPVIAFAVANTFSPGPNNVMSASLALAHGYRRAVPFMLGITAGFAVVMLLCAAASAALLRLVPALEPALKWVGAAYILWLAWYTWAHRDQLGGGAEGDMPPSHTFGGGFLLQFANVKVLVYGLMFYSSLLVSLVAHPVLLTASAVALALTSLASISLWALGGSAIRAWLRTSRDRAVVAGLLALTLVYVAAEMVGASAGLGKLANLW